jgi:Protein of unknown function (DUF2799)
MTGLRNPAAILSLLTLLLAACSSMSEKQCRSVDWSERGERDAYDGQVRERIASYQDACSEFGIQADAAAYNAGYAKGLRLYCTPQRGYAMGKAGSGYRRICPPESEPAFLTGYDTGKNLNAETQHVSDLERQIRDAERRLKDADSAEDRDSLRRRIRDLDDEMSLVQRRIRRLQDEAVAAGYQ